MGADNYNIGYMMQLANRLTKKHGRSFLVIKHDTRSHYNICDPERSPAWIRPDVSIVHEGVSA